MNPDTEEIEVEWNDFYAGTWRGDIWHWFEKIFDISVAEDLMHLKKNKSGYQVKKTEKYATKNKRKVLFTNGMSEIFLMIITDAPKEAIESYCRYHNEMMENGGHFEMFSTLKSSRYYVKELLDSELDGREDIEIIGYDEAYDFSEFW